jgi:hypothetical protein
MPIIDDYAAIASELRRLRAEKLPANDSVDAPRQPAPHRMRATIAGELLYRRLVSQRIRRPDHTGYGMPFSAGDRAASLPGARNPLAIFLRSQYGP